MLYGALTLINMSADPGDTHGVDGCIYFNVNGENKDEVSDEASEPARSEAENEIDDELNELLDSALQDFENQGCDCTGAVGGKPVDGRSSEGATAGPAGNGTAFKNAGYSPDFNKPNVEDQLTDFLAEEFSDEVAKQFDEAMKSFMAEDPVMMQQIEKLARAAENADSAEAHEEFASTLASTLSSLAQNAEGLQEEDLNQAFQQMGLHNSAGGNEADIFPVMQGMMKTLLSKEVLYPSLKEISQKYPKWLKENKEKINKSDCENYTQQYEFMKRICLEFEQESPTEGDETKRERFSRILELMQQMQELGQPPKDIVGEMAPGLEFDENGIPKLPQSPDQCSLM